MSSLADSLRSRDPNEIRAAIAALSDEQAAALLCDWRGLWARPNQILPEGNWLVWLILAGRGFGKTRTGAEAVRERIETNQVKRAHLVGATSADVRDVMVEGESGILAVSPPWFRPTYEPSKRRLTWPNGSIATCFSADEPERLRGPQCDFAWADELGAWRYAEAWDQLQFGLRLGSRPQVVVTTTPRPRRLLRELVAAKSTIVTRGSTYDNLQNLTQSFRDVILSKYEGTTLGRQEIHAEMLDEAPGALWKRSRIDELRVEKAPEFTRLLVAVDPAITNKENSDETGIVWGGLGADGHAYVCGDLSMRASPDKWAQAVVGVYRDKQMDRIVYEANQGGDLVASVLRTVDKNAALTDVHASRGKRTRAEPVAALYEQGKVHHVGMFRELEDQLCNWAPGDEDSPDRLDALVWLVTALTEGGVTTDIKIDIGALYRGSQWEA